MERPKHDIEAILAEQKVAIDKVIEEWLPRTNDVASVERMCGKARYAYDVDGVTEAISKPMWDILDRGGKRWRPVLLFLIAEALGGEAALKAVKDLVVICEVVHNGTLVVDDIEDDSKVRRGKECVHLLYGVDIAVNAGNAMYYLPTTVFKELKGRVPDSQLLRAYELYCQEMSNLHIGQGLDIWWHRGGGKPTADQYLQMCAYKTGTLARLSAKLSALFSGGSNEQIEAVGAFAEAVGVGFQVQDDILNLVGDRLAATKGGYGEDIHEGKRTLMVLRCLEVAPPEDAARLMEILAAHPTDQAIIDEAIAIIKRSGAIEYASERARELVLSAWQQVESTLTPSDAKDKLHAFALFLVERAF